jgi:hypothetical protein
MFMQEERLHPGAFAGQSDAKQAGRRAAEAAMQARQAMVAA